MTLGIRAKLFASFTLVLLLVAAVAGFGLLKFGDMIGTVDNIANTQTPAIIAGYQAKSANLTLTSDLRQGLLTVGTDTSAWQKTYANDEAAFSRAVEAMKTASTTSTSAQKIAAVEQAYTAWTPLRRAVYDAVMRDDLLGARAVLFSDANVKAQTAVAAGLDDFTTYREGRVKLMFQTADDIVGQARMGILGGLAVSILFGLSVAFVMSRSVSRGVKDVQRVLTSLTANCATELENGLRALADKDLTFAVVPVTRPIPSYGHDEIGQTAAVTNELLARLQSTVESYEKARANLGEMVGQVQRAADQVADTSSQLESVSSQTGAAVQQVTQAIQNVASGAGEASRGASETNASVEQLSQAIDGIARGAADGAEGVHTASQSVATMAETVEDVATSARAVAEASQLARSSAERGGAAVHETTAAIAEIQGVVGQAAESVADLGRLSERIGAVVETIDDIAEQTNLLALNAAIEAARAGEHGKGFAVVADEVRKLAERSSRETKQIGELIAQVQSGTRDAVMAMEAGAARVETGTEKANRASSALTDILGSVEDTARQAGDIAAAVERMSGASHGVSQAMTSISAIMEQSSAASEQMSAQANGVTSAIAGIAAVSEEQSAATEEVSASSEEMSAQVEEMSAQAQQLAATARELQDLVGRFRLRIVDESEPSEVIPLPLAA